MFRLTIRDALWLTVVVAMAAAVLYTRSARVNDLQAAMRRAAEQELEAVNARYKAAKGEFHWVVWLANSNRLSHGHACDAAERLARAVEEMGDLELRVSELAKVLEVAQSQVSVVQEKYEHGTASAFMVYRVQYTRADVEARLRRAKEELAVARAKK
jgi:hypothetical protein